jgi:hypothetical protein
LGWDATGEAYAMVTGPADAALDGPLAAAALVLGLVLTGAALLALQAASATSAAPAAMTKDDLNRFLGTMNRTFLGR